MEIRKLIHSLPPSRNGYYLVEHLADGGVSVYECVESSREKLIPRRTYQDELIVQNGPPKSKSEILAERFRRHSDQ